MLCTLCVKQQLTENLLSVSCHLAQKTGKPLRGWSSDLKIVLIFTLLKYMCWPHVDLTCCLATLIQCISVCYSTMRHASCAATLLIHCTCLVQYHATR